MPRSSPATTIERVALAQSQTPDGAARRTLLYVEDNPANLELVEQIIARRTDLRMLGATEGSIGIEFARAYQPDVILMDINLPGISGIDAMRVLRADPATAHIPIIALSANAVPRDIAKALDAGFFSYITKPIKVEHFMETLDVAMKHSQSTSARACRHGAGAMIAESEVLDARILIVDDQETNVSLLRQVLSETGYSCIELDHEPARGLRAPSRERL